MSSSMTFPEVGSTSRLMQRISVLFPAPDGPMIVTTWGSFTLKLTSCSATVPVGYTFERLTISSILNLAGPVATKTSRQEATLRATVSVISSFSSS
jgi:hypothetical protein